MRAGIALKISLVALCFTLPVVVLTSLYLGTRQEAINFATQEIKGNRLQRPLETILDVSQRLELWASHCRTDTPKCEESIAGLIQQTGAAISELSAPYEELKADLQFVDDGLSKRQRSRATLYNLRSTWEVAEKQIISPATRSESTEAMKSLADIVKTMITHQGDTSNLILDPDLDSYYLMDVTLLALPQTQARLADVIEFSSKALAGDALTPADRVQLNVHQALLSEADISRVVASSQTSINEDANFYGVSPTLKSKLTPALEAYQSANARYIDMLAKVANSEGSLPEGIDREAFFKAGLEARAAAFAYWNVAVDELDALLNIRVNAYTSSRLTALVSSALSILFAGLVAFFVMRSIVRPLNELADNLGPGANLLNNSVKLMARFNKGGHASPEELAMVTSELIAHADDMRSSVNELQAVVRGGSASQVAGKAKNK